MSIKREIESIYLNELSIIEMLLTLLSENIDYIEFFQKSVDSVSVRKENLNNE